MENEKKHTECELTEAELQGTTGAILENAHPFVKRALVATSATLGVGLTGYTALKSGKDPKPPTGLEATNEKRPISEDMVKTMVDLINR